MALHIQISEEAEKRLKRTRLFQKLTSVLACLSFLSIVGAILYFTYKLIEPPTEIAMVGYVEPEENAPPTNKPKTKQQTRASASMNVAPSVIVSTSTSNIAMAEIDIPIETGDIGVGLAEGFGVDIGDGVGSTGAGMGSSQASGSALEGTFYDFKQTRGGAATAVTKNGNRLTKAGENKTSEIIGEFFYRDWSPSVINKYFQPRQKIYASHFYIPRSDSLIAPATFGCEKQVKDAAWIVVFRGKVRAPKTGTFRFLGAADDLIAVRFNKKLVLEAGWSVPSYYTPKTTNHAKAYGYMGNDKKYQAAIKAGKEPKHPGYELIPMPELPIWNDRFGGMVAGQSFKVVEGEEYPIEILVSEVPGAVFGYALLIDDMDNPITEKGRRMYDLFRTGFDAPTMPEIVTKINAAFERINHKKRVRATDKGLQLPKYNPDSLIWPAVP